jgi:uncharacterized protein
MMPDMITAIPHAMPVAGFMGVLMIGLAAAVVLLGLAALPGSADWQPAPAALPMAARRAMWRLAGERVWPSCRNAISRIGLAAADRRAVGRLRHAPVALFAGTMFGAGLAWSGMADPHRVRAFLDLLGTTKIDRKLALGAVLFGMGWGISGLCPGPALADLGIVPMQALPAVLALFAGMAVHRYIAS